MELETKSRTVRTAPAGRQFTLAVRELVHAAQSGDPLAPVTVVVPSNLAGLSLRRLLGSDLLDDAPRLGPTGIANVSFATPFQFASTLAATSLAGAGARPLTTAVLAAAVRHVLRVDPRRFERVAHHTATESALVRTYAELTTIPADARRRLAERGSDRAAEVVAIIEAVSDHLAAGPDGGYHDESAVFAAAAVSLLAADGGSPESARSSRGSVVLAGPYDQGPAAISFLTSVWIAHHGSAVVAATGDATVDEASLRQIRAITGAPTERPPSAAPPSVPVPTALIPASDSDEEVRAVLRRVLALARQGETFDRMAVFYPSSRPYARTLREQFDAARVPTAGPDHRRLADSMAGRLLLRLFDLAEPGVFLDRFGREDVLALVSAAPVRGPDGRRVRAGAWETVSRKAGVLGGIDDWRAKLTRHDANLAEAADDPRNDERSAGFFNALGRERQAATDLRDFAEWIHGRLGDAAGARTWAERSAWAVGLLDDLLPPSNHRMSWPETEVDAAERIEVVLRRVGVLDSLEPGAPFAAFVRAVELELDGPAGSRGRFGTGVLVSPLSSAAGVDIDHAFIVGLSEGICPRPIGEDTLLPDADRQVIESGMLAVREDRLREQRRRFLSAVASGTKSATLVMPTGDHRNGRKRTASRWWIEALVGLGAPVDVNSQNWESVGLDEMLPVASFTQASHRAVADSVAVSEADLQMHHALATGAPHADDSMAVRASAMEAMVERGFTRFGGDLAGENIPPVIDPDRPVSATRLESWATCPRRYFFSEVLGLGQIEAPDKISEISALDRGSLWHTILEDFISEALPGSPHAPTSPDARWTAADRARLHAHARRRFAEYEEAGVTGRPLLWEIDKEKMLADLDQFLEKDSDMRAELRTTPDAVELAIGMNEPGGAEAAVVELPDGREVMMRGFADRIDRRTDGSPVVIDYKTGRNNSGGKRIAALLDDDPVVGGTKLQLGVYAEAASQHYHTDRASAWYWFTSEKGSFDKAGYEWTAGRKSVFTGVLQTIVEGIEGGLFPPNPGEYNPYFGSHANCSFCDFTSVCPVRREAEHELALEDPRMNDYLDMVDPPEPFADGSES